MTIFHEPKQHRFTLAYNGHHAHLYYRLVDEYMALTSTQVPPEISGLGAAKLLVENALSYMREHNLYLLAECSYVKSYVEKNPSAVADRLLEI